MLTTDTEFEFLIAEYSPGALLVLNDENEIVYANRSALSLTGYKSIELLNYPIETLSPAALNPNLVHFLTQIRIQSIGSFKRFKENLSVVTKSGEELIIEASVSIIGDSPFLILSLEDITERRREIDAIAKNKASLEFMQSVAKFGIWEWDLVTDDIHWTPQIYRMLDVDPKNGLLTGETFMKGVHPDDVESVAAQMRKIMEGVGDPLPLDYRYIKSDGSTIYLHAMPHGYIERNDKGVITAFRGVVQDVTERKKIELENERLYRELDVISRSVADIILKFDEHDNVIWAKNIEKLFEDCTVGDLNSTLAQVVDEVSYKIFYQHVKLARNNGEATVKIQIKTLEGPKAYHFKLVSLVENGKPSVVAVGRDITELENLQRQWQHSQKMDAIGKMTGGIAHDFNNILAVINGFAFLIDELVPINEGHLKSYVREIIEAGDRAQSLIQNMLLFSRGVGSKPRKTSLVELVDETIHMMKSTIPKTVQLVWNKPEASRIVNADKVLLQQALVNILINARDATNGVGRVEIDVVDEENDIHLCCSCSQRILGHYTGVKISDTGNGISPDDVVKIFQPFFTTKEIGRGSGLGLAMVHGVIHEHKGHILLETERNHGSQFTVLLPKIEEHQVTQ